MCDKNGISGEEGGSVLGVNFWKIQRGGGVIGKIPSVGGVWIFSGTTHCELNNCRKQFINTSTQCVYEITFIALPCYKNYFVATLVLYYFH